MKFKGRRNELLLFKILLLEHHLPLTPNCIKIGPAVLSIPVDILGNVQADTNTRRQDRYKKMLSLGLLVKKRRLKMGGGGVEEENKQDWKFPGTNTLNNTIILTSF